MLEMMKRHREWWVISECLRLEVLVAVGSGSLYLDWLVMLVVMGDDLRPYGFVGQFDILRPVGKVTVCLILTSITYISSITLLLLLH